MEALKRLQFDSKNEVIYPLENLQIESVRSAINEWMEKQVFVKILLKQRNIESRKFVFLLF